MSQRRTKAEIECPSFHDHTPAPEGYLDWHAWAERMSKTHRQIRCTGCGRFAIWIEKKASNPADDEVSCAIGESQP